MADMGVSRSMAPTRKQRNRHKRRHGRFDGVGANVLWFVGVLALGLPVLGLVILYVS